MLKFSGARKEQAQPSPIPIFQPQAWQEVERRMSVLIWEQPVL
jgi:hypothetical protein